MQRFVIATLRESRLEASLISDLSVRIRQAPPREALARRFANALRAEIASGRLRPGMRLSNEVSLAKALVSGGFARLKRFRGGSLYNFLRLRCGLALAHSSVLITAITADRAQARQLALKEGTPLLLLREAHMSGEGRPVLYTVNYHNSKIV